MASRPACRAAQRLLLLRQAPSRPRCRCFSVGAALERPFETAKRVPRSRPQPRRAAGLVFGAGILALTIGILQTSPVSFDAPPTHDGRDSELPRYRIAEVRKHGAGSENPWVIYHDKVYDITDWIPAHPGGKVILRAAGASIDPYWDIFSIHKEQYVREILAQYLIGYVDAADLVDGRVSQDNIEDPFVGDPQRHASLITRTAKPRNAETPGDAMADYFLTPNDLFYVRNHMWVPKVEEEPAKHLLTIELLDGSTKQYTLDDLKTKFQNHTVTAAMQCSGNRRKDMSDGSGRGTNGLQWSTGAISNASWEGVSLADVLKDAGFELEPAMSGASEEKHVQFSGLEAYGASIPIKKAIDPQGDVILAYAMNGLPLPRDHGFPLRAIVPGHVAARSVKWLSRITLSDEESATHWQRKDYKCFGPNETDVDWDAAPAIQELPVQSAITGVKLGEWKTEKDVEEGEKGDGATRPVSLSGYAYSGGGRAIIRVDVSLNGGSTWAQAHLTPDCVSKDGEPSPCAGHLAWSWQRWTYSGTVPLKTFQENDTVEGVREEREEKKTAADGSKTDKRCTTLVVKATDEAYNAQPESHAATWNLRGNLATAWHRVKICADCSPGALTKPSKGEGE